MHSLERGREAQLSSEYAASHRLARAIERDEAQKRRASFHRDTAVTSCTGCANNAASLHRQ